MMLRFFDILFSSLALLVLSPLFILVIIILRFTGEGEVFYIQQRIGQGGKKFGMFKFVTMLIDSENMGTGTLTIKNDPRVLPVGKYLRKAKINELPQLFNVFLGDMSLIGPRPQTERCFLAFPKTSREAITKVKPGLSGIGSIVFRDEEKILENLEVDVMKYYEDAIAPYKGKLEEWYVRHQSLYVYFMLIGLTVWSVFFSDSKIYNKVFRDLPKPPKELDKL